MMTEQKIIKRTVQGRGSFILGCGPSGTFGHVELLLEVAPGSGQYSIQWHVKSSDRTNDERQQVEEAVINYLRSYVAVHPEYGLHVTVTEVITDEKRHNDYARAVWLAFYSALQKMGLPTPQIFSL